MPNQHFLMILAVVLLSEAACSSASSPDDGVGGASDGGTNASGGAKPTAGGTDGFGGMGGACEPSLLSDFDVSQACEHAGVQAVTRGRWGTACTAHKYVTLGNDGALNESTFFDTGDVFVGRVTRYESFPPARCPANFVPQEACEEDACILCASDSDFARELGLEPCP